MTPDERPGTDCFISYSWDSESHRQWVIGLGTELRKNGVDVCLNAWHTMLGDDLPQFMEAGIRDCNHVVIVCTPNYAKKANARKGGAGYESAVITGEIFQKVVARGKFLTVTDSGEARSVADVWERWAQQGNPLLLSMLPILPRRRRKRSRSPPPQNP